MAWNEGYGTVKRYNEMYDSAKTGTFGVAGDIRRLEKFVEGIGDDSEKKAKFCEAIIVLVEEVSTPEEAWSMVMEKLEPMSEVLVEMITQYPDIIPEEELGP